MLRTLLTCLIVLLMMCLHSHQKSLFLTYHRIDSNIHVGLNVVHPDNFRKHVKYIAVVNRQIGDSQNPILITFDDGYESVFTNAFPVMEEYGLKGIVFPITGYIGKYNDWDINFYINRVRHLNITQIQKLSDAGWQIGSHGHRHRAYSNLTIQERIQDLNNSKIILEDIVGKSIYSFCPPFGNLPMDCWKIIQDAGYRQIYLPKPFIMNFTTPTSLIINFTRSIYSIDNARIIQKKYLKYKSEIIKENIIRSFSWGTVLLKEML